MGEDDKIQELQRESEYLYAQLEEITKELARLDLLNIKLTQQKRQAIAAFNFIKFIQEKIEKASTIDDLYFNIVNVMTAHLFMDSSALLKINFETKDVSILASAGLSEDLKGLKLDETVSKQELVKPTFVSSKSSLQSFQEFVRDGFKFPYFVWYPIADEEDGTLVLFVGNKVEDTVLKQPFSEESLETFGAIASVILLRRDNIATTLEMLRKKEERINFLVEILETSPVSVIATDKDVKITYVNLATEKLTGYKAEELIGKDLGMLNADPKAAEIQKELVDTISQGKVWRGEILNKKKNGELYYILASVYQLLDEKGNFMAMVGFQEDITERKNAEEALQSSELQYRTTIDSVDDPIHVVDKDLRIILFNNAFKRWAEELNLETEVIGQTLFEPFPFLPGKVREEYLQVFNTGKPLITEETVKVGSKEFITETRKIPVFEGEKVVRVITVVRDITEKKKAEEALKQRAEELEKSKVELQRSLQELLERVEHEYKDLV
ncbi:MAG: PAS domain-containing protein, partial [Candidatus Hodarchaeota archaeon]